MVKQLKFMNLNVRQEDSSVGSASTPGKSRLVMAGVGLICIVRNVKTKRYTAVIIMGTEMATRYGDTERTKINIVIFVMAKSI